MISILVTYYNQEKYVSRSLESILAQKLTEDFEILVGDDGSQDNTCKIVQEYSEKYPGKIRLFIQPRDLNVKYSAVVRASYNRLNLLKNAKGDYVCFLDGDDEYCDYTWLQESVDILNSNKKLVGVAHNYKETYEDGSEIIPKGLEGQQYITAKLYCRDLYTPAGAVLFRRVFTERDYKKLIQLKAFDDHDITFYFLNYGDLLTVNKIVYNYYQNSNSIWNSANELEKSLLVGIDFEVISRIIKKHHKFLLIKYFPHLYFCYRNKQRLSNKIYEKYKVQCLKNRIMDIIMNWDSASYLNKIKIHIIVFYYRVIFKCLRLVYK